VLLAIICRAANENMASAALGADDNEHGGDGADDDEAVDDGDEATGGDAKATLQLGTKQPLCVFTLTLPIQLDSS
jgi:hypothetical protein